MGKYITWMKAFGNSFQGVEELGNYFEQLSKSA
jgi:hypothetical protein